MTHSTNLHDGLAPKADLRVFARPPPPLQQISLFDNAATSWESDAEYARALLLDVDLDAMTVGLATEFLPYNRTVSPSQGNIQLLEDGNGNAIVGWGQTPRWSEFTADGTLILDVQFGVGNVQSYRGTHSPPPTLWPSAMNDVLTLLCAAPPRRRPSVQVGMDCLPDDAAVRRRLPQRHRRRLRLVERRDRGRHVGAVRLERRVVSSPVSACSRVDRALLTTTPSSTRAQHDRGHLQHDQVGLRDGAERLVHDGVLVLPGRRPRRVGRDPGLQRLHRRRRLDGRARRQPDGRGHRQLDRQRDGLGRNDERDGHDRQLGRQDGRRVGRRSRRYAVRRRRCRLLKTASAPLPSLFFASSIPLPAPSASSPRACPFSARTLRTWFANCSSPHHIHRPRPSASSVIHGFCMHARPAGGTDGNREPGAC